MATLILGARALSLKLPSKIDCIGQLHDWASYAAVPPGFYAFDDHSIGNGDYFGLYWPIGFENAEPLVAETVHDEHTIVPAFSSLDSFLQLTADLDDVDFVERPTIDQDPLAPHACYQAARSALAEGRVDMAIDKLHGALARLPEYTAALATLTLQHLRQGERDEACRTAVCTIRSPPSFGAGAEPSKVWRWLSQQQSGPVDLAEDPIWVHRAQLASPPTGGAKENPVYPVLARAIDVYVERDDVAAACTLMQAYAEFMTAETISFAQRYGFSGAAHRTRQMELSAKLEHGPRSLP
jgi:hypothetical protein